MPVNRCFIFIDNVKDCITSLKNKNVEAFVRIPREILRDSCNHLVYQHTVLINKIYHQKEIPDQWRVSKIIPVHKKEDISKIEKYRPISNLCPFTKIFS